MKTSWLLACALCATCATATFAQEAAGGGSGRGPTIVRPTPAPPPGWVYRWIGPVYQTIPDRIWIADRIEMVREWVEISPGRLEQVWRQIVTPGHYETTTRRVLVSDGHYELVRVDPPVYISPPIIVSPPVVVWNPGTVGVDGYKTVSTEDLSKFSPLTEWPDKK